MNGRKLGMILGLAAVAAGLGAGLGVLTRAQKSAPATADAVRTAETASAFADASPLSRLPRPTKGRTSPQSRPKPTLSIAAPAAGEIVEEEEDTRTPEERKLAEKIEKALDNEDFKLAISCAAEAQACANAEIRQSMVDTLGWFGSRAIPELTPFLADADEDVRDSALMEWSNAISDVEDDAERIRIVELAMQALSDEDQLEDISGEYIGVDEALAVGSLLNVIEGGGTAAGIAKAKETYEFVTGEEFTNRADAENWVREQQAESE